jgi:hypothetical protein
MKHAINKNLSIRKNIYIYTYIFGIINLSLFFILNNKKKIKRKAIKYVKYLDKKFIWITNIKVAFIYKKFYINKYFLFLIKCK